MHRRAIPMVSVGLFTVLLAGCGSSSADTSDAGSSASGTVVSMKLLQFMPQTLTVKAGTKVTWRNDEPITHTVTSGTYSGVDAKTGLRASEKPDGLFDARAAKKGDTTSYTFSKPGTYPYYCSIHKGMNGKVVVTG